MIYGFDLDEFKDALPFCKQGEQIFVLPCNHADHNYTLFPHGVRGIVSAMFCIL